MALTKTQICNLALAHIGIDQGIANIDTEQSKAARLCRQFYPHLLDEILGDYEWTFATAAVKLATPTGDPPIGWSYQYAVPADCLSPIKVTDYSGARSWSRWSFDQTMINWPDVPFRLMRSASAGTRVIVTDLPEAYLVYTARIENTAEMSAAFISMLAWRLAVELAMPMAVEPNLRSDARQGLEAARQLATNKDARDQVYDPTPDSPSVQVR